MGDDATLDKWVPGTFWGQFVGKLYLKTAVFLTFWSLSAPGCWIERTGVGGLV